MELWVLYRQKYGMLNPGIRVEHGAAMVSATLANINRKTGSPPFKTSDFMVNGLDSEEPEESGYNELEQAFLKWQK